MLTVAAPLPVQTMPPPARAANDPLHRDASLQYRPSLGQQRFWVLDRLNPGDAALNVAVRWRIEGQLPTAVIASAFAWILARHEPLRTAFAENEGEPIQFVQARCALHVPSIDLTVLGEAEAFAECESIAKAEAVAPFNLAVAPLIRATHVKVRPDVSFLLVTAHHIVCDGWSIGLLAAELGEICDALQSGRAPALPELPLSYGMFSESQRDAIAHGGLNGEIEFWGRKLAGLEYAELPTDMPRTPAASSASTIDSVLLDRRLTDGVASLARSRACTLFTAMLSALATLLHRYTEVTDVAIGTQIAGRSRLETENLVGLFINTVVLRLDLSDDPTFADLLEQGRDLVADAIEHGEMPLEKVIETLKPKRHPGHNALFSVNFIFQRSFIENTRYGRFSLVDVPSFSAGAMYDLNFFMVERPEGWRLSCEFNKSLYEAATVSRLLKHLIAIAGEVSRNPLLRLSEIPVLNDDDRRLLHHNAAGAPATPGPTLDLPAMIDAQASRTPAAAAVVDAGRPSSYAEISRRSTALARRLVALGLGPGKRIGVYAPRTADLVIAPLAVMKAGSAYVPLDPIYPAARLQAIVEQSQLSAVVVRTADAPPEIAQVPLVVLDDLPPGDDGDMEQALPPTSPDSAAYVIFTSGSTGRPKGVAIPHRALANFMLAMRDKPGLSASDTFLAVTTLCFDIAALELFGPLTIGGRVVLATARDVQDGARLLSMLKQERVSILQATPTTWRMLIEAGWDGAPQLRMLCGGEALPQDLAGLLLDRSPELWNMYGPTETTIWSTANRLTRDDPTVCIGSPIANTRLYVADRRGGLVPPGAVGELLIGGSGVALGYWGMPEATAERFVPDPYSDAPGATMYRTGDVVRMLGPGRLVFMGRQDDQVKVRGFRIELGEIETVLRRHADVRNAVAVVERARSGEQEVAAYVELRPDAFARSDEVLGELRLEAARVLPAYMRPGRLAAVERMPRLPNGKLNRKALSRPELAGPDVRAAREASSAAELRLKAIWRDILGVEQIDGDADFFELGGQSLLAARMLARVETAFGRRISLTALFNSPSLTSFAKLLHSSDLRDFDFRQVVRLNPRKDNRGMFAINNTGLFVSLSRRFGDRLSLTGLQLFDPAFYHQPIPETLEEIASRYAALVRQLQPVGPYVLLGFCDSGILAFETARQLEASGGTDVRVVVVDTWAPRYLNRLGPVRSRIAALLYRWKSLRGRLADPKDRRSLLRDLASRATARGRGAEGAGAAAADPDYESAQRYDSWLNTYLARMVGAYEPKPMTGRMTVIRGSREPSGWLLDMSAGWAPLCVGRVDQITVPGDHITIFQEPGVSLMARHIEEIVLKDFADAGEPATAERAAP